MNLLGVWRTVRTALPHVVARQGYILSIASLAAALHPPMLAHYAATKAGVEAFSDSLRARSPTPARASAWPTSASSTPT